MTDKAIDEAIAALDAQETSILDEFPRLEVRLSQIRTAKAALLALKNEEPAEFDGSLADACRLVLQSIGRKSLHPTEVRDAVRALGYDITKHDNQMAAVHSVLKRLKESGEVDTKELRQTPGQKRYFWVANFLQSGAPTGSNDDLSHIIATTNASLEAANTVVQQHHAARARAHQRLGQSVFANALLPTNDESPLTESAKRAFARAVEKHMAKGDKK